MLVDSVDITLKAGKGGDGIVSWRHEKFIPKGGPDGGDGGRGASVVLVASHNLDTLSSFRYRKLFHAEDGERGFAKKMYGKAGEDLELLVPVGTLVTNQETGEELFDFTEENQRFVIAKGGKGGLGNVHFATSTHQKPTEHTLGQPGETIDVTFELRLIADIALIGLPNAGKSSIINAVTDADARIGAYPFSTTDPILGVMRVGDKTITIIDLPGLIEGAHQGKGLGDKFLKHTQRVKAFLHVIDATDPDTAQSEKIITEEIRKFDKTLVDRPRQLVFNKIDLLNADELKELKKQFKQAVFVSAKAKININELRDKILELTP